MRGVVSCLILLGCVTGLVLSGCGEEPPPADEVTPAAPTQPKDWSDHTQGLPFVVGYQQGLEKAGSEGKPAMMFVTTTWCGWCKKLADDAFTEPEIKDLLSKFVLVIVDGDVEEEAKTKLGTQGYPHIVFLSPSGQKVGECLGYRPAEEFQEIVQNALAETSG